MNIGMLWFDNDVQTDIGAKIYRAAEYYKEKYGSTPNLCFIHPSMTPKTTMRHDEVTNKYYYDVNSRYSIEIRTTRAVLPNHFWLGVGSLEQRL